MTCDNSNTWEMDLSYAKWKKIFFICLLMTTSSWSYLVLKTVGNIGFISLILLWYFYLSIYSDTATWKHQKPLITKTHVKWKNIWLVFKKLECSINFCSFWFTFVKFICIFESGSLVLLFLEWPSLFLAISLNRLPSLQTLYLLLMSRKCFRVNPCSLPECQGHSWPVWPNGWVFVYKLSGSGFESSCSHLNLYDMLLLFTVSYFLLKVLRKTDDGRSRNLEIF